MSTEKPERGLTLQTIEEALRAAEKRVQEDRKKGPSEQELLVSLEKVPETVRLIREARLKRKMREEAKRKRHKERWTRRKKKLHPTQKKAKMRDRGHLSLWLSYRTWLYAKQHERWTLTFEEYGHVMGRYAPYQKTTPLWVWCERYPVTLYRKDAGKPWTLDNISPKFQTGLIWRDWTKLKPVENLSELLQDVSYLKWKEGDSQAARSQYVNSPAPTCGSESAAFGAPSRGDKEVL